MGKGLALNYAESVSEERISDRIDDVLREAEQNVRSISEPSADEVRDNHVFLPPLRERR